MSRLQKRVLIATALLATVASVGYFALMGQASDSRFRTASLTPRSNVDKASLSRKELWALSAGGIAQDGIKYVGEVAGTRYYVASSNDGASCYLSGRDLGPEHHFGVTACSDEFPSTDMPILDYTVFTQKADELHPTVVALSGFAADGVDAVGVKDEAGTVHWVKTHNNIYGATDLPAVGVVELVARDTDGEIIYARSISSGQANPYSGS